MVSWHLPPTSAFISVSTLGLSFLIPLKRVERKEELWKYIVTKEKDRFWRCGDNNISDDSRSTVYVCDQRTTECGDRMGV